jgi:hypothetical protein
MRKHSCTGRKNSIAKGAIGCNTATIAAGGEHCVSFSTDSSTRKAIRFLSLLECEDPLIMDQITVQVVTCTPLEYREAGASPALPRNCERGRNLRKATGRTAGKEQGVGRSVSQET